MKNEYYHEGELSFIELGNGTYAATIARQHFDLIAAVDFRTNPALANTGYGGRTPGCDIELVKSLTVGLDTGVWS